MKFKPRPIKFVFSFLALLVILVALPLTVITSIKTRDNRSQASTTPNDPCFVSNCPNFPSLNQWNLININAPSAWDVSKGSSTVKVAVLGTGVVPTLTDLQGQLGTGYNAISPGGSTSDDFGTYGDGTGMAAIIGAIGNNGTDMAGINWSTTILPVKVCDLTGSCTNPALAAGVSWAVSNGAKIIVIGVGKDPALATPDLTTAVANAVAAGVIVIAPSGNFSGYIAYPANQPGVISVGSVDQSDVITTWSGRGNGLILVAPGQSITSLARQGCCNGFTGGEFAASQVAGAAALLLAANVPASQVQTALTQGAKDLGTVGYDTTYGNGRLDICGALNAAGKTCPIGGTLVGDTNGDGRVNVLDLSTLLSSWNTNNSSADFNKDGKVDVTDLSILLSHWTG